MPFGYAMRERFHLFRSYLLTKANKQNTGTDVMYLLACDGLGLDGNRQIKSELEKKLK